MSKPSRSVRELRFFWVAMSFIGYSPRQKDIDDVIDFVASFGERGVKEFQRDLRSYHDICKSSGLTAHITRLLAERLARVPSTEEIQASLEDLAVSGQYYFAACINDHDLIDSSKVGALDSTLGLSLQAKSDSLADTSASAKSMKKVAPLRRDGSTWISTRLGLGLGVRGNDHWPFSTMHFMSRIEKMAAVYSQSEDWLPLRKQAKIRQVDINVEWWWDVADAEAAWVKRRGLATVELFVPRQVPAGDPSEDADGVSVGDEEARIVMSTARGLVAGLVGF